MKETKTTDKQSEIQDKDRAKVWKNKATCLRAENTALRKRVKELRSSRDSWKEKYKMVKTTTSKGCILVGEKASGHHYSVALVCLILELHKYGSMSLRSCRNSVCCMLVTLVFCRRT